MISEMRSIHNSYTDSRFRNCCFLLCCCPLSAAESSCVCCVLCDVMMGEAEGWVMVMGDIFRRHK